MSDTIPGSVPEPAAGPSPEPVTYSLPEALRFFRGDGGDHPLKLEALPLAPPWRRFKPVSEKDRRSRKPRGAKLRFKADGEATELVNIALLLRRPLLVTGKPGIGKSSLAYAIAHELKLGKVLVWPIASRSTLQQGLYSYDAVGRLQDVAARNASLVAAAGAALAPAPAPSATDTAKEIGRYIRLGPLGTALLSWKRPRVLLIDEIDKSDIDLPNDLLHVFEEGEYEIPELARLPADEDGKFPPVEVWLHKSRKTTKIHRGHVRCRAFPLVLLTSNGEREFPPAFLRRCLRLDLKQPGPDLRWPRSSALTSTPRRTTRR